MSIGRACSGFEIPRLTFFWVGSYIRPIREVVGSGTCFSSGTGSSAGKEVCCSGFRECIESRGPGTKSIGVQPDFCAARSQSGTRGRNPLDPWARQFFLSQTAGTRGDSRAGRGISGSQFNRCRLTRCVSTECRLQAIPEEGVSSHRNPPIPLSSQAPTRWRFWSSCWRVAASTRSTLKSRMQR